MSTAIHFLRVARREFDDAADWYDQHAGGKGPAFTAAVRQTLDLIAGNPQLYAEVQDDVRAAPVHGFPYCVYYRSDPDQIVVLAVFHNSRDPAVWQSRV